MTQLSMLDRKYRNCSAYCSTAIEVWRIFDEPGERFDELVRKLYYAASDNPVLEDCLNAAKRVRSTRAHLPLPARMNYRMHEVIQGLTAVAHSMDVQPTDMTLLADVTTAAEILDKSDSPCGDEIYRTIVENAGEPNFLVIPAPRWVDLFQSWLAEFPQVVIGTATDLQHHCDPPERVYAVAPPFYFPGSLVTSPVANELIFLVPSWFRGSSDLAASVSVLAEVTDNPFRPKIREFSVNIPISSAGSAPPSEPGTINLTTARVVTPELKEISLQPTPEWELPRHTTAHLGTDDVMAQKMLLSGGKAIWIDSSGERIRVLDPMQPEGRRVANIHPSSIVPGTYLLLKSGTSERGAFDDRIKAILGQKQMESIEQTQKAWKARLSHVIDARGNDRLKTELLLEGVKAYERGPAWADPDLIRPSSDADFRHLLQYLSIDAEPTFHNATLLRRTLRKAISQFNTELESLISADDLNDLLRIGHFQWRSSDERLRGMVAARVLAISPDNYPIKRQKLRCPFESKEGRWIE